MWFHNIGRSPKTDFTVVSILAINNIFEHENVKKKIKIKTLHGYIEIFYFNLKYFKLLCIFFELMEQYIEFLSLYIKLGQKLLL